MALVFDRAPTLLVRGDHAALGAPVAIAWDASAQAGRAVRAALPILAQAPAVAILQCPQGLTGMQREAADPARLRLYLMQHGVIEPKVVLTEVIDAAETFELGKVRRDAMASIEQLKTKGPASARNTLWWGQAGQTALALGCIVAGAMGHVEVGVPCIIGGAASSAALKYMVPGQ